MVVNFIGVSGVTMVYGNLGAGAEQWWGSWSGVDLHHFLIIVIIIILIIIYFTLHQVLIRHHGDYSALDHTNIYKILSNHLLVSYLKVTSVIDVAV